jgi:hypothetical protein
LNSAAGPVEFSRAIQCRARKRADHCEVANSRIASILQSVELWERDSKPRPRRLAGKLTPPASVFIAS